MAKQTKKAKRAKPARHVPSPSEEDFNRVHIAAAGNRASRSPHRGALPVGELALDSIRVASGNRQETVMNGKKALVALAVTTALSVLGISSAAGSSCREDPSQCGGFVVPCSLDGVNPVYHPHIFGNPAVARSYGFVRSRDGGWHVAPNCRR